ncbi:MAG: hydrogenase nickel incorporation protein HypB [Acidobacteriota bacterium]|jgi:hydrogenase nickel incorporation protein HypB|nr:hydrogenase nickel incorporation protein HypB [Acidobacteriota bacterium]
MCQKDSAANVVDLQTRILARNDDTASHNREHFLERGIFALNVMGSPGSGKTAVLEATARTFADPGKLAALAGDLATDNDAARLQRAGLRSRAIETGQACHLDAELVHHELHHFDLTGVEIFFIENVGNLVCPAVYDLGQAANVVVLSITEGEDKPLKYPTMFAKADLVLLTKMDLLPHLPFVRIPAILDALAHVMPDPRVIALSPLGGDGIAEWLQWLTAARTATLAGGEVPA